MKKICISFLLLFIIFLTVGCNGTTHNVETNENELFLRIHVRANSNEENDQEVKYLIKDKLVCYLTPLIANCRTKSDAVSVITLKSNSMKNVIDQILQDNGFSYASKIIIRKESFPTRVYDGVTLESGYYDAVIVELGKAQGDNWWCVVYPPLCFTVGENVRYKSKILELIQEFRKKYGF